MAAEKRLKRAYDKGGFPSWARTALQEVDPEARVERVRRQREMDEKAVRSCGWPSQCVDF